MKVIFVLVILCGVLITSPMSAVPQTATTPEATVRSFYEWYLYALNHNQDPLRKQRQKMSKFVTQRLMTSLNRALRSPEGIDADLFIDAQDWDESWEKNISVSEAEIAGTRAIVNVTLKGGESVGDQKLKIALRKEGGGWKIDGVNGRINP